MTWPPAILQARQSGSGQVLDAAMTDGAALLMSTIYGSKSQGIWSQERGSNMWTAAHPSTELAWT